MLIIQNSGSDIAENFGNGSILVPQNLPHKPFGNRPSGSLVYTHDKIVISESIDDRFAPIPFDESLSIIDLTGKKYLFLGSYFKHYGHFITETFPMLSYCFDPRFDDYTKIFIPFYVDTSNFKYYLSMLDKGANNQAILKLIYSFIDLMQLDKTKIQFHIDYNTAIKADFLVPPKVVNRDKLATDVNFFKLAINRLKRTFNNITPFRKVMILRKANRLSENIVNYINNFCNQNGFDLVNMGSMAFEHQIRLMHEAKTVVGFSGSGMHNCMFMQPESMCINLGDFRDVSDSRLLAAQLKIKNGTYLPTQKMCAKAAGCRDYYIDFKCQDNMDLKFKPPWKYELTQEQENYAIGHYITELQKLIDSSLIDQPKQIIGCSCDACKNLSNSSASIGHIFVPSPIR